MNIRTEIQLSEHLDADLSWRKKELSIIKSTIDSAGPSASRDLQMRQAVVFLYAHWEGFVKESSRAYLYFLNRRNIPLHEIQINLLSLSFFEHARINRSEFFKEFHSVCESILLKEKSKKFKANVERSIHGESNLNFEVFEKIADGLKISVDPFEPKRTLINKLLVEKRHLIAHGTKTEVDYGVYTSLHESVIELLNLYKNQIENLIATKAYIQN